MGGPPGAAAAADAVHVVLVGDSTMAPRTGYGDALCALFPPQVTCTNLARGGRSSKSYRAEGLWDGVMQRLGERATARATYVLIQFGHNDQPGKAERSTDLATEFPANIARYVDDVRAAGATPVLLTPLTRRAFREEALHNDLEPWADATRRVGRARQVPVLELNARSAAAVALMGSAAADTLAMAPPGFDRTHLGPKGAAFFARLVARELARDVPSLPAAAVHRPQLSEAQALAYSYREVLGPWDPASDPLATAGASKPDYRVDPAAAADGKTTFHTVQAAVDAAIAASAASQRRDRVYIRVRPGTYRELLYVPDSPAPITLYGGSDDAAATRISATLDAAVPGNAYARAFGAAFATAGPGIAAMFASVKQRATVGTSGSAVAWIRNNGFQAKNLTFENTYNRDRGDAAAHSQAVALMVDDADRVQFENVRFLGYQDTLYLKANTPERPVRVFLDRSYVEGNVDFIFGEATAYFRRSEIRSLGDRRESYATAASTHVRSRFGFVFDDCRFTHDGTPNALARQFKLGRQWFRGGSVEAVGKVAILNSRIGAHIDKARPWSDWGTPGSARYRPVQYDAGDEPWLAEYNSTDE